MSNPKPAGHSAPVVMLVDDAPMVLSFVSSYLRDHGYEVHTYSDAAGAIADFEEVDPDILMVDIALGSRPNGVDLANILKARAAYLAVVCVSGFPSPDAVQAIARLPHGAAFVNKAQITSPEVLLDAIDSAVDDSRSALQLTAAGSRQGLERLTAGQLTMLRWIADGWTNAEIAEQRNMTLRATERMVGRVFDALGLSDDARRNPRVVAAQLYVRAYGPAETPDAL